MTAPLTIDTRKLQPGDTFAALDGQNVKGYTFIPEALKRGASSVIAAEKYRAEITNLVPNEIDKITFVSDPALALAQSASDHRAKFSCPVAGIAGSVGKTSTKEFLAYLLSRRFKVLSTAGNLNNHLGLPMMLSRLTGGHDCAVLEMGSDHVGDLSNLVRIAEPTHGLLTPVAPEHLSGFGSLKGVYDGELEILESPRLKVLVTVAGDHELDRRLSGSKLKIIRVGCGNADVIISEVKIEKNRVNCRINGYPVRLPTAAAFMALNAGLAAAMAVEMGMRWEDISGDWNPELSGGRFNLQTAGGWTLIDDTYNSSPLAFTAALETYSSMETGRKWIVFSDMLELGAESAHWHSELGQKIAASAAEHAWAFGPESRLTIQTAKSIRSALDARHFDSCEDLCDNLRHALKPGDWILFKGSRGMRVERVLNYLKSQA